jgi:hypothetical protein
LESKPFLRRFGTDPLKWVDSSAIFEIASEQSTSISQTEIDMSDEHPVPPFPFPRMLLILPDYVLLLEQPEMDLDTSVLEFRSMLYIPVTHGDKHHEEISFATIRLDVAASRSCGRLISEVVDLQSQIHLQGGVRIRNLPADANDPSDHNEELLQRATDPLELSRFKPEAREQLAELVAAVREKERVCREQIDEYTRAGFTLSLFAIAWINQPKHYIVEHGPESLRKPSKKKETRTPRLGERSRHIIVGHDDVRRRWAESHGSHASPMPHLRRGHFKTLRAERFKEKRGKVIWVSPCHVNGACVEWREGAVAYKVVG